MTLTGKEKRELKRRAHHLRPVIHIGAGGASEALLVELDRALHDHELVKVRVTAEDKPARGELTELVRERTGATLIQRIGHIIVLYRKRTDDHS